jgi:chitodextrinase
MTMLSLRRHSSRLGLSPRRRAAPAGSGPPGDTEAPSVPQNLSATAISDDQIDLTWDASTDNVAVAGYRIYRDNVLVATSPTNSYSNTGLDPATEYEYEVSAIDAESNESARSAPDSATTEASGDTEAPSIPQNLSATAISDDQIDLTWAASTDNVGVTGYNIYRDNVLIDTSPTNSYSDTGLDPATEYEYEVSAFDAASNESARSAPDSATTHHIATPVNFNGATRLIRGAALTGVSDSKVWSGSMWLRLASTAAFMRAFNALNDAYQLLFFNPTALVLFGKNVGGSIILRADLTVGDTNWHHLLWSFDLADSGARHFYLDDASVSPWLTYSNDLINFAAPDLGIGDYPTGANPWNGDMADLWLRFGGSVIDFSVEANRRLFITAEGKPASPSGWPSGGQVGFHGEVEDWHTNKLGGGGFTVAAGALGAGTGPVQLP